MNSLRGAWAASLTRTMSLVFLASVCWPSMAWAQTTDSDEAFPAPVLELSYTALAQDSGSDQQGAADSAAPSGQHDEASLHDITNKLNNPGSDLASLNFKLLWTHYKGDLPESSSQNSLSFQFQPVLPFKLDDEGHTLVVRPTFNLVWQPTYNAKDEGFDEDFGLGDSQLVAVFAHTDKETGFIWGVGPTMQFPTHTDDSLGNDAFWLGPAGFAGVMGDWGILGVFPQHWWNIGGGDGYTALTAVQLFYWFSVGQGYQIGGDPTISYDWAADDSSEGWAVPVNLGVQKTIMIGSTPVKFNVEAFYYVEQPDAFGPHYGLQLKITPVTPNPIEALFAGK